MKKRKESLDRYNKSEKKKTRQKRYNSSDKAKKNKRRWRLENPERWRAYRKKWSLKNQKREIHNRLKWTYGISLKRYDEILEEQNGVCAVCGKTPEENGKRLSVDHCHKTKIIRGLLCDNCNKGMGNFKDNVDFLLKAVKYLSNKYHET